MIKCLQRKCISAVLSQNPTKHASNIYPNVFNSFYWTVTHGEYHEIIYKIILLSMATHFFRFKTPNKNPPKQVHAISMAHHPPSIPRNKSRRHMNPVVNSNFLSFNSPQFSTSEITTSKVYWSPKARFLIAFSNYFYKVIKFSPWVSLNVNRTTISLIIMGYKIPGLTHLLVLGRQGKHVWLIVRQLPMKMKVRCSPHAPGFSRSNLHVC